ncbi:hypothetical protein SDJN03_22854, partial [Cucurbita argyrosperma subsp. sororia]
MVNRRESLMIMWEVRDIRMKENTHRQSHLLTILSIGNKTESVRSNTNIEYRGLWKPWNAEMSSFSPTMVLSVRPPNGWKMTARSPMRSVYVEAFTTEDTTTTPTAKPATLVSRVLKKGLENGRSGPTLGRLAQSKGGPSHGRPSLSSPTKREAQLKQAQPTGGPAEAAQPTGGPA